MKTNCKLIIFERRITAFLEEKLRGIKSRKLIKNEFIYSINYFSFKRLNYRLDFRFKKKEHNSVSRCIKDLFYN